MEHVLAIKADYKKIKAQNKEESVMVLVDQLKKYYEWFADEVEASAKERGFEVKVETTLNINF